MMFKPRVFEAGIDLDMGKFSTGGDEFDTPQFYRAPYKHQGRKLRHARIPYNYVITDGLLYEGLDTKLPIGTLKPPLVRGERGEFSEIKHAGSYTWHEPLMRDQLGVDFMALGERVLMTPSVPDVLGDPTTVKHLESDNVAGMIDYIIDSRDASILRPTFSPFESLFHTLSDPTHLDSIDIITDHTTLISLMKFLRDPTKQAFRTDVEYTTESGAVVLHQWMPKIMYGPGEPHRGWVNSYTRRVTSRDGAWEGGTTQIIRYTLGGMGFLIRCPVSAMLASSTKSTTVVNGNMSKRGTTTQFSFDTKHNIINKTEIKLRPSEAVIDRSKFVHIKVYSRRPDREAELDLEDLYIRLVLTQTHHCLIVPHHRDDFALYDYPPIMVSINDPIFDQARSAVIPVLRQAIAVWKSMIAISKRHGKNVSFVGKDDGTMRVMGMSKGRYEHVGLRGRALEMLDGANASNMSLDGFIKGYSEHDRTMDVGDWARSCHRGDPLVARWEDEESL